MTMNKKKKEKANVKDKNNAKGKQKRISEKYVPPQLIKFDKLEKLIVSGE